MHRTDARVLAMNGVVVELHRRCEQSPQRAQTILGILGFIATTEINCPIGPEGRNELRQGLIEALEAHHAKVRVPEERNVSKHPAKVHSFFSPPFYLSLFCHAEIQRAPRIAITEHA